MRQTSTLNNSKWTVMSLDLLPRMTYMGLKVPHSSRLVNLLRLSQKFTKIYIPTERPLFYFGFGNNEPCGHLPLSFLFPSA